ncbi:phosphoribosyl-ATP diphosphatase [Candidatus Roizmanbacteria bacterium CG03_land_8_20_14_0_80_35_26]|uniref:Phosphoribosyl-ATP pyrophosphatase n=2 Tax=Candidatus Roizmaniibacteriota TaxID=1752723 RepID=A0A2M7BWV4_9BACT|nr:MAG: phosphoribosyl-ATP diphosphatase [Candidatus Roizmanbacteria bacterium CG03_land_8_20_14_0_80_35_26]PJC32833.1 MAG: phosphoribosyl-ATP diphosphatase [Candidatus Roizmanbacteria bacterium CG_4_9_14_0_2_um_filter_36_12]PJC80138.1 MAG: phosphoribosyl-ATP diphosphatase [Candidatus Roizmanbacteria bacterium CG_4_8_14_3_um_filter_36_12]
MTIDKLYKIIKNRRLKMPKDSYVASLFRAGQDRIIQKIGEEATEVIIAAKNKNKKRIVSEIADLWFYLLVMLISLGITPKEILQELDKRNKK